ncbi:MULTISPECIES: ASCH domain-containing protein [Pseudomonas]|uniref:ASCH domain-containing protein n=1 Tax=Pseudomonas lutea TaxID=243924 RepID=A0A9X8MH55_9PSED|nr:MULTISPECIES: ASCH domain-containing protein [Pseudomonas]SER36990.1 ASCH domain-containing protein [Pseudomonas lutea]
MRALSIRQPWAWLIVHGGKIIENRTWYTKHRGAFLIHASKGMTKAEYGFVRRYCIERNLTLPPPMEQLQRGGIVGMVDLVNCHERHDSPWYMTGHIGFELANPKPLPFTPMRGQLGFFETGIEP